MLSINVPEWVCLCLSCKAIEILQQRWRRTSNWNPLMIGAQSLNYFGHLSYLILRIFLQISKDRKLLMLSINVPEWVCLCLSRKAIEILRQRWRRTSNWKVCTLWHQHRGCANLKTFLSLSFLHLNFQSSINWFLYRSTYKQTRNIFFRGMMKRNSTE